MKYRNFLQEVSMAQLHQGRNGVRLVGLALLVPHVQWNSSEEWEQAFRKEERKNPPASQRTADQQRKKPPNGRTKDERKSETRDTSQENKGDRPRRADPRTKNESDQNGKT